MAPSAAEALGEKRKREDGDEEEGEQGQRDFDARFERTHCLKGHGDNVAYVAFSSDGLRLASCSADETIVVWDPAEGKIIKRLDKESAGELGAHDKGISCVAWSPDSETLCSASDDRTLRFWRAETGECIRVLTGHTHMVMCCDFSRKGNMLVSGSYDETVRVWEVKSGLCLKEIPAHSDPVTSVRFSRDASMFVSSSWDGLCRVWDTETGKCLQTVYIGSNAPVSAAMFTPNCHFLLANHLGGSARLWDLKQAKWVKEFQGKNEKHCITPCIWTHQVGAIKDPLVICGSDDGAVFCWDISSQKCIAKMHRKSESGAHPVLTTCCNPRTAMFATAADKEICVFVAKQS